MILSDLAKYSMTRSVARSLCDSWATCYRASACWYNNSVVCVCHIPVYYGNGWTYYNSFFTAM